MFQDVQDCHGVEIRVGSASIDSGNFQPYHLFTKRKKILQVNETPDTNVIELRHTTLHVFGYTICIKCYVIM